MTREPSKLLIDLTGVNGSKAYEVFGSFSLSSAPNYTLNIEPGTGTAGMHRHRYDRRRHY